MNTIRRSIETEVEEDIEDTMERSVCKYEKNEHGNEEEERGEDLSRDVFMFDRLENDTALPVIKRLLKLYRRDPVTPINLYINSSGGNGYNADAIIATMCSISTPVNTICLGHALSGACEVLAAGTGLRSAYEFSTMMIHQTLWETDGDITNLEIQAAQGLRFREAQIQLLHRCTGQAKERIRKDIDRDFYISAREALDYGLIDKIIQHRANRADGRESSVVSEIGSGRAVSKASFGAQSSDSMSVRPVLVREGKSRRGNSPSYKK